MMKTKAVRSWNVAINISRNWAKATEQKPFLTSWFVISALLKIAKEIIHYPLATIWSKMLHRLWCPDQLSSLWMRHKMEHAFECVEANMKCVMIKTRNSLILPLKGNDWIGKRNGFFAVLKQFLRPAFVHLSLSVIRQKHKFAFHKKHQCFEHYDL